MALKIKRINVDLSIDLTEYIPAPDGLLDTDKKSPEQLFDWVKMISRDADKMITLSQGATQEEIIIKTREILVSQVDWFYNKGPSFWASVPFTALRDIVDYIRGEVLPAQKK